LIRNGALCRSCTGGKCRNIGTAKEQIEIECPLCNGGGCGECEDRGAFVVEGCPNDFCQGIGPSITLFDLFEKGLPPIVGGALDQSVSFVQAAAFFSNEERRIEIERIS